MTCKSCNTFREKECTPLTIKMVGGVFTFDGRCIGYSKEGITGTVYGIEFVNGEPVGYVMTPPELNPPVAPCAPVPSNCPPGGGGGGSVTIDPNPNNLSSLTSLGVLTTLHTQGANGISVAGSGTLSSPLVISGAGSSGGGKTYVGGMGISIADETTSMPIINLDTSKIGATGQVGGLVIADGIITTIMEPEQGEGVQVVAGLGITVDNVAGNFLVALEGFQDYQGGKFINGRQRIVVDTVGRVTSITKSEPLPRDMRNVQVPQGTMVFDEDGILKTVLPIDTPIKQVFKVSTVGTSAATGTIDVRFPGIGKVLITVCSFSATDKVEMKMLSSESLDWVEMSWSYPNTAVYANESELTTVNYTITPGAPAEGTLPSSLPKDALIIFEYLGL